MSRRRARYLCTLPQRLGRVLVSTFRARRAPEKTPCSSSFDWQHSIAPSLVTQCSSVAERAAVVCGERSPGAPKCYCVIHSLLPVGAKRETDPSLHHRCCSEFPDTRELLKQTRTLQRQKRFPLSLGCRLAAVGEALSPGAGVVWVQRASARRLPQNARSPWIGCLGRNMDNIVHRCHDSFQVQLVSSELLDMVMPVGASLHSV